MMEQAELRAATRGPGCGAAFAATRLPGMVRLEALTEDACTWLIRSTTAETTWIGNSLMVDSDCFPALAEAAIRAGLTFESGDVKDADDDAG